MSLVLITPQGKELKSLSLLNVSFHFGHKSLLFFVSFFTLQVASAHTPQRLPPQWSI